jgi:hypothetical protein
MIVVWSILYVILYLVTFILFFIILTISIGGLYTFFGGTKHIEVKPNIVSINNNFFAIVMLFISIGLPYFFFNGVLNYNPPFIPSDNPAISVEHADSRLKQLEEKEVYIEETLSNIENLTIKQITTELSNILDYVKELKNEAINQQLAIEKLEVKQINEQKKTDELIKKSDEVSKLTQPQLDAIKYLITEDANKQNSKSFWFGILISFPIGVFASVIANSLLKKIYRKKE